MTCDPITDANGAARAMLDAFTSVGAKAFDLTVTDRQGLKVRFRRSVPHEELLRIIPAELAAAARLERNVIVRPRGPGAVFVQLDDLSTEAMQRVQPVSFMGLETSPMNYQAWIAMHRAGEDIARQVRKGTGADPAASGATRVAGSFNFKDKYAPSFPRVEITHSSPGLTASKEKLAQLALLADVGPQAPRLRAIPRTGVSRWPSYQRCVAGAPPARDNTRPDISRADFTWCLIALDWGWGIDETADRLMTESSKARQNGQRYALRTAQRAAAARRG